MRRKLACFALAVLSFMSILSVYSYGVSAEALKLDYHTQLITASVDASYKQINIKLNKIPYLTLDNVLNLDLTKPSNVTVEELEQVLKQGLSGLAPYFIEAEKKYSVNCLFLVSIAIIESGWGTKLFRPNNMFGFGQIGFSSKAECIDYVASKIAKNYLSASGPFYYGTKIQNVHTKYATSPTWSTKVGTAMASLYQNIYKNNQK